MAQIWWYTISVLVLCYVSAFFPKHTLWRWVSSFVSQFLKELVWFCKISFCSSWVKFIRGTRCWGYTFINYVFSSAFPLQKTIFLFSTAAWLLMMVAWINKFCVVWFDNISHILCATVVIPHYSYWKFYGTCSNVGNADLSVEGTVGNTKIWEISNHTTRNLLI